MIMKICNSPHPTEVPKGPRNVALIPSMRGLDWSNDLTEAMLYLITMCAAPWLLRQGQHIRVDIVLRAIPKRIAWYCEWFADQLNGRVTRWSFTCENPEYWTYLYSKDPALVCPSPKFRPRSSR